MEKRYGIDDSGRNSAHLIYSSMSKSEGLDEGYDLSEAEVKLLYTATKNRIGAIEAKAVKRLYANAQKELGREPTPEEFAAYLKALNDKGEAE